MEAIKMAEVSKDLENKAYEAIEIAKKTGKLKRGTNEVTKIIEKGLAKLVVYARDVNPQEIVMHLEPLCQEKNIKGTREDIWMRKIFDMYQNLK